MFQNLVSSAVKAVSAKPRITARRACALQRLQQCNAVRCIGNAMETVGLSLYFVFTECFFNCPACNRVLALMTLLRVAVSLINYSIQTIQLNLPY